MTQSPESNIGTEPSIKSKAQQQQEKLEAAKRKLAEENAQVESQQRRRQRQNQQGNKQMGNDSPKDCGRSSIGGENNLKPVEVTQFPESDIATGLNLKYYIILEQPNRKFALSHDWRNFYVMNLKETDIREYIITRTPEPETKKYKSRWDFSFNDKPEPKTAWHEEIGRYSNGARMILTSVDNLENPSLCQVKIRGMTKTYKFEKVIRIEV